MNKTSIGWCDWTWNPVTGCSPFSDGCANCYAERMFSRGIFSYDFSPMLHSERLGAPLDKKRPSVIFVCSMGDLFHEDVPFEWVDAVFDTVRRADHHRYLFLTKRSSRMMDYSMGRTIPDNAWFGVTVESSKYEYRVDHLLCIAVSHRFVSIEPMLGRIDWSKSYLCCEFCVPRLDWVIVGGETGPGARVMDANWARLLRDQCFDTDTPFFMKQMTSKGPIPDDLLVHEFP